LAMRIATWNLRRPRRADSQRTLAISEYMRQIDADIWILTETHESISPGSSYTSVATTGTDREQSVGEQWTIIWSRFPVVATESTTDPIRTVCATIASPGHGTIVVYGTVLPWASDMRLQPITGADAFVKMLVDQTADWERLRTQWPNALLCVAGDFNQNLSKKHYCGSAKGRDALRASLVKTGLHCATGDDVDPVYRLTDGYRSNIDHICIDDRFRAASPLQCGAWPSSVDALKGLSDHFGTWVDV